MEFNYSPLDQNELRLLRVLRTTDPDPCFEISHFDRRFPPSYTAASYTWGEDTTRKKIRLNGKIFYVTTNLWSFLYYLTKCASDSPWTYIWVDAICIDQSNIPERNDQVRVMDEIYRNAVCVSVWLGLEPGSEQHESLPPSENDGLDWERAIIDLANRPYWSRVWVIQEFLLAQKIQLYCGGSRIDWISFKDILTTKTQRDLCNMSDPETASYTSTSSPRALPLLMDRHPDRHPEVLQPLNELLIRHRQASCKDPRDRVFGMLGLVPPMERRFLGRYFPDYSLTENQVIIIALSHVWHLNEDHITTSSEDIFSVFGIHSKKERARLVVLAEDLDYVGCERLSEALLMIEYLEGEYAVHGRGFEKESPAEKILAYYVAGLSLAGIYWIASKYIMG